MIVLKADKELNLTFQKLIKMMDAPVEWNGMFFVVGDYLILQGSVRSLFFNFDTKLVVTNIIELKAEEQMIAAVEQPKCEGYFEYGALCVWKVGKYQGTPCGQRLCAAEPVVCADPWGISGGIAVWTGTFPLL